MSDDNTPSVGRSSIVRRYRPGSAEYPGMVRDTLGGWVEYEEVSAILADLEELKHEIATGAHDSAKYPGSTEERLDALVHELTGDEGEDDSFTVLRRRWAELLRLLRRARADVEVTIARHTEPCEESILLEEIDAALAWGRQPSNVPSQGNARMVPIPAAFLSRLLDVHQDAADALVDQHGDEHRAIVDLLRGFLVSQPLEISAAPEPDAVCPKCQMQHFGGAAGWVCMVGLPDGRRCDGILQKPLAIGGSQ